jgi:hypothetical protein
VAAIAQSSTYVQSCVLSKIDPTENALYTLPMPLNVCQLIHTGVEAMAIGPHGSVFLAGSITPDEVRTTDGAHVPSSVAANAYATGTTDDVGFPTTPAHSCRIANCGEDKPAIFVAKLNADGSKVFYSTFITQEPFDYDEPLDMNPLPPFLSIAVDSGMQATVMQVQGILGNGPYPSDTPSGIASLAKLGKKPATNGTGPLSDWRMISGPVQCGQAIKPEYLKSGRALGAAGDRAGHGPTPPRSSLAGPILLDPFRDFLPLLGAHGLASSALSAGWRGRNGEASGALQLLERSDHPLQLFFLGVQVLNQFR